MTTKEAAYALVITPERLKQLATRGFAHPVDSTCRPRDQQYTVSEVERLREALTWLKAVRER